MVPADGYLVLPSGSCKAMFVLLDYPNSTRWLSETEKFIAKCRKSGIPQSHLLIVEYIRRTRSKVWRLYRIRSDYRALPLQATGSERHTAGRATSPSACDPYIYSGSQRVCAILIRCFSDPSAPGGL
jgi:hypothetical protein